MSITTTLPTAPSTGSPSTFEADMDAFLRALPIFQAELDAYAAALSPLGRNMLINPAFQIDQRNAGASTAVSDDGYCFDRWYVLTQTASVAASQVTDPENGYTHALRLTQSQASAQRFGLAQIVEGKNCKHARGNSGTFVARVRCSASTTIRYAIIGWTGTEDAVTSDIVNSWTNSTFTAGQFFTSTTTSVLGTGSLAVTAAAWTSLTAMTASLGSSFTNIVVFVWTDSTQAQNVTLDFDYAQFEVGASANSFERRSYGTELSNCQRYYRSLVAINAVRTFAVGQAYAVANAAFSFVFSPPMRTSPTFSSSGSFNHSNSTGSASAVTLSGAVFVPDGGRVDSVGAGLTAGNASYLSAASDATATLKWDAEL